MPDSNSTRASSKPGAVPRPGVRAAPPKPAPPKPASPKPASPKPAARYARGERLRRLETWVPIVAVGLVAISAVLTAVMSSRFDTQGTPQTAAQQVADASAAQKGVVKAPPLKPPTQSLATAGKAGDLGSASSALGAGPACSNCGVIEMVVAVHGYAQAKASGYQMHIRMDDGSVRTLEQRGALPAGSRVIVERDSVRVLTDRAGQG